MAGINLKDCELATKEDLDYGSTLYVFSMQDNKLHEQIIRKQYKFELDYEYHRFQSYIQNKIENKLLYKSII